MARVRACGSGRWEDKITGIQSQDKQKVINPGNAANLALKWSQTVAGNVSATPAIVKGAIYFPDWGGYLNKLDARTGQFIWRKRIDSYPGEPAGAFSRTSPAIVDDVIHIGDPNGGHLMAIEAETGNLKWSTVINPGLLLPIITQSPVVYRGVVYVGVASSEEGRAADPSYPCCKFQGSFSAVDARTGKSVMFAGSMSGHMYALDAANGKILWDYLGKGSSNAGPSISNDGAVYWSNGYTRLGIGTSGTTFYAFSINGK